MMQYKGYNLPAFQADQTMKDLCKNIIRSLRVPASTLSTLVSIEKIEVSQKYLAVAEFMRFNPDSEELRALHETYVSILNQLPDEELYQVLVSFPANMTLQQFAHWMNDVDTNRRYVLTSEPRCTVDRVFLFKVLRLMENIDLTEKLFEDSKHITWRKKWRLICKLTRTGSTCPDIKMLPVIYFRALKKDKSVKLKEVKEDIEYLMTAEEGDQWNKIVGGPGLISRIRKGDPQVWISLMQLAVGFYGLVNFLGDGALYHGIGVFITFLSLVLVLALIEYMT